MPWSENRQVAHASRPSFWALSWDPNPLQTWNAVPQAGPFRPSQWQVSVVTDNGELIRDTAGQRLSVSARCGPRFGGRRG